MTYGFTTKQIGSSFAWAITRTTWNDDAQCSETVTVKSGTTSTRAKATGAAKRWVLFFRRGGSL